MGQKCSCFIKEDENKNEKRLEDETLNRINITKNPSNKEEFLNDSFIQSKYKAKAEQQNNYSERNKQNSISLEANNYLKTDNSLNNAKTNLIEKQTLDKKTSRKEFDVDKVNLIKRNMAIWFYRKRFFEQIKDELMETNENLFNNLMNSENVKKLEALSAKCKKPFNLDDWKNYHKEFPINLSNEYFAAKNGLKLKKSNSGINFELIFGKTFKSKKIFLGKNFVNTNNSINKRESENDIRIINNDVKSNANDNSSNNLIPIKDNNNNYVSGNKKKNKENKNYVYVGEVNKYNQKHGKGVLYNLDGTSREEGTWFEDELIGWVRVIFSAGNGLVIEGNLLIS